jgi:hypothetical protein
MASQRSADDTLQLHRERFEQLQIFRLLPRLHAAFAVRVNVICIATVLAVAIQTFVAVAIAHGVLAEAGSSA